MHRGNAMILKGHSMYRYLESMYNNSLSNLTHARSYQKKITHDESHTQNSLSLVLFSLYPHTQHIIGTQHTKNEAFSVEFFPGTGTAEGVLHLSQDFGSMHTVTSRQVLVHLRQSLAPLVPKLLLVIHNCIPQIPLPGPWRGRPVQRRARRPPGRGGRLKAAGLKAARFKAARFEAARFKAAELELGRGELQGRHARGDGRGGRPGGGGGARAGGRARPRGGAARGGAGGGHARGRGARCEWVVGRGGAALGGSTLQARGRRAGERKSV